MDTCGWVAGNEEKLGRETIREVVAVVRIKGPKRGMDEKFGDTMICAQRIVRKGEGQ